MNIENLKLINVDLTEIRKVRKKVLYKNLSDDFSIYDSDNLSTTKHFGLLDSGNILSVMTIIDKILIFKQGYKSLQIRGMATLERFQKRGYGTILLKKAISNIDHQNNYDFIWCNARKDAIRFYTINNFTPVGDEFTINKIGIHKLLYRKIRNER